MGMFDYVKYEAPCFKCGTMITEWQTKDLGCNLDTVTPEDIARDAYGGEGRFYDICPECKAWNEHKVRRVLVPFVVE